jgi:hypothetical protein
MLRQAPAIVMLGKAVTLWSVVAFVAGLAAVRYAIPVQSLTLAALGMGVALAGLFGLWSRYGGRVMQRPG